MPWGIAAAAVIGAVASNVSSNRASGDIKRSTNQSIAATQDAAVQARRDVNELFPQARQSADLGFQGALDVFSQSVPFQINAFQQGNLGAQQQILAGLPQIQNAILGGNIDLSGLQPVNISTDLGFLNQQLPVSTEPTNPVIVAQNEFTGPLQTPDVGIRNPLGGFTGIPSVFKFESR